MSKWPPSESVLAAVVVDWLHRNEWDVYQEVSFSGRCIDIVARRGAVLWAIECKTVFGLDVIGQAEYWKQYAHCVSVAVPLIKDYNRRQIAGRILSKFELGLITASSDELTEYNDPVRQEVEAPIHRRVALFWGKHALAQALCEEQKTFVAAGGASPKFWSPFKRTCRDVAEYVAKHPGISFKQLLDEVPTHYANKSSARRNIAEWIEAGKVEGVRLEKDGRDIRLFPQANEDFNNATTIT